MSTPVPLPVLAPPPPAGGGGPATTTPLPPLYARWMEALLGGAIPGEPLSTCSHCAMSRPPAETATAHTLRFRADAKCCTYLPTLWNFLAGGPLSDDSPEAAKGRATVEHRLGRAVAVTPLGLRMSSTYEVLYRSRLDAFGRNPAFRCPHYLDEDGGLCGVWRHRNAVCATYFCKLTRGAVGNDVWARVRQLLGAVEENLARWCLLELEVEPDVLQVLFPTPAAPGSSAPAAHDLDGGPEPEQRLRLWGRRWVGREAEFYRECHRRVAALSWREVLSVSGPLVGAYARLAQEAYGTLAVEEVPDLLQLGKLAVVPHDEDEGVCYLSTYTLADMPKLPAAVLGHLPLFDGRHATRDVVARIEERTSVRLSPADVRLLVDHRVLVPVAEPPVA